MPNSPELFKVLILRYGQVRKNAAAKIVGQDEEERGFDGFKQGKGVEVVQTALIAQDADKGPLQGGGNAAGGREEPVDAGNAAIAEERPGLFGKAELFAIANGHAGSQEKGSLIWQLVLEAAHEICLCKGVGFGKGLFKGCLHLLIEGLPMG